MCEGNISMEHYTWLMYMLMVHTQPMLSAVRRYIEEMLTYQRNLKIKKSAKNIKKYKQTAVCIVFIH